MTLKLPPLDPRIPTWNSDDVVVRNCPICNTSDSDAAYERPDGLIVRICNKCRTYFISPSPSDRQLNTFYEKYGEIHRRAPNVNRKEFEASYKYLEPFTDIQIRELSSILKFESARILDVGFGRASFLYYLKKLGAIPIGLELDTQAIEFARSLGIEAFRGNLIDFDFAQRKFDAITMLDFVEHPLKPMSALKKSSELLDRGGLLLIWTPNGDYANIEKYPTTFRVDLEHMQYFTAETCLFIASELGLHIVHLETLGFPWSDGIDQPLSRNETPVSRIKGMIKSIPGFSTANDLRHKLFIPKQDERIGAYHLFCIMQKPA